MSSASLILSQLVESLQADITHRRRRARVDYSLLQRIIRYHKSYLGELSRQQPESNYVLGGPCDDIDLIANEFDQTRKVDLSIDPLTDYVRKIKSAKKCLPNRFDLEVGKAASLLSLAPAETSIEETNQAAERLLTGSSLPFSEHQVDDTETESITTKAETDAFDRFKKMVEAETARIIQEKKAELDKHARALRGERPKRSTRFRRVHTRWRPVRHAPPAPTTLNEAMDDESSAGPTNAIPPRTAVRRPLPSWWHPMPIWWLSHTAGNTAVSRETNPRSSGTDLDRRYAEKKKLSESLGILEDGLLGDLKRGRRGVLKRQITMARRSSSWPGRFNIDRLTDTSGTQYLLAWTRFVPGSQPSRTAKSAKAKTPMASRDPCGKASSAARHLPSP